MNTIEMQDVLIKLLYVVCLILALVIFYLTKELAKHKKIFREVLEGLESMRVVNEAEKIKKQIRTGGYTPIAPPKYKQWNNIPGDD